MKVAILGTKGIPNNYGGYEQFAEFFSRKMAERGHEVTVYNPSFHPFKDSTFHGVAIRRAYSPEKWLGGAANFIYDFLCLRDALNSDFDIVYEAGYHSVAVSYKLLNIQGKRRPVILTNMDGLEYRRSKWNWLTRQLIRRLEKIAVNKSHFLISDNEGIQEHYRVEFGKDSFFIPYGADPATGVNEIHLKPFGLTSSGYVMLVARMEPENSLEMILEGHASAASAYPMIVVGNAENSFGRLLKRRFESPLVRFVGGIYDKAALDSLRHFSAAYFHGHSVGGTNPSLLEAMGCGCYVSAHDNVFNRSVLRDSAHYFKSSDDVAHFVRNLSGHREKDYTLFSQQNLNRLKTIYSWERIIRQHEELFMRLMREATTAQGR